MSKPGILICTVGTGDIDKLRETLLEPLKKTIRKGEWSRVILLPSQLTKENATKLREEVQDIPVEINELPQHGAEDDADACFAHFDGILASLRAQGVPANGLLVDFTRGTKAMSAALVLAAVRHDLPQLRYISSRKRDERGMVVPGTEVVAEVHTTIASAQKRMDDCYRFFQHGNFAAVLELLPDPHSPLAQHWPNDLREAVQCVRPLATFASAWDRLDYKGAQMMVLPSGGACPSRWSVFLPSDQLRQWVATLAQPFPDDSKERAVRLRLLVADLLANGERRVRDQQYEDGIIRAYRVLELVGQIRLFDHGLDSAALPPEHPVVEKFHRELVKNKSTPLTPNRSGQLMAAREQVARLLKRLDDPLAQRFIELGNKGLVKASVRNLSVWIHGFEAVSGSDPEPLRQLYKNLEQLILDDGGSQARKRLQLARWLDFTHATAD
ncbi:MAG: TIGR02710 family CRISPR-associated CARF protein [Gemmataceae bacterium]|nr:TIGR02710 family CRISPR-associated CARF protein [Gemmataceae bacterium]MCI0739528.1 TIGR02710 family CRISPR-associated CARF protein [Gemmataceae bacterium]